MQTKILQILLHKGARPEDLGLLPYMLDPFDPRPASQQFDDNYQHGGGWMPIMGFLLEDGRLKYPGDPPLSPIGMLTLNDEVIVFFEHALVCVVQKDGSFEVARMD
jgi:hypothetical protein